jgi:uncharacterized protein
MPDCAENAPRAAFAVRRPRFDLSEVLAADWHGGDPFKTAVFNGLSMMLPIGEQYIIDAVRRFQNDITAPLLRSEVQQLIGQESVHRLQHASYNEALVRHRGYSLEALEAWMRANDEWANANLNALEHLAVAVAYEHLTASIAYAAFVDARWFAGADGRVSAFWFWHALEELEHKSIAFEVYIDAGGQRDLLKKAMVGVTYRFLRILTRNMGIMFRADRSGGFSAWVKGLWFFAGPRGLIWALGRDYAAFYRPNFHPNERDDSAIMARAERLLQDSGVASFAPPPSEISKVDA